MGEVQSAVVTAAVALMLGLVGCGDDEDEGGGGGAQGTSGTEATGPVAKKLTIAETEYKLNPSNPRIAKAGEVEVIVKNAGKVEHALEVEGPGGEVETEGIAPGKTATLKVDLSKPGSYVMYCPIANHRELGMEGRIGVAGGGADGGEREQGGEQEESKDGGSRPSGGGY